ncbi:MULTISPECIES: hypothetical protein [unclassified Streptomyces]|uniref:hypothetical protein n=1 Tax=unclassified Streptomyces TaxID=2593676 RepID=UPI002DDBD439|nr:MULTISPECIES: hypothetical protein [unclassified Streptomyces]WSA94190.1 hypothetical protein OIE63_23385 [Streptomyces sp. NBC_01795]WSB78609.1 hypothetical protein OHB04_24495 [Streptomyces sp. NBC_01775]WSS13188.1 hypothetical protein OG533_15735 [Streptomyces sp. NBC_01186]WSS41970.1 hypothetical protein OG220_16270 [Streptomyces sp. NBC_01187]
MSCFMYDLMGGVVDDPGPDTVRAVLKSLAQADDEHPDVSLSHTSGWSLTAFQDGRLIWENPEDDRWAPGELRDVPQEETLRLFTLLAAGETDRIERLPWRR